MKKYIALGEWVFLLVGIILFMLLQVWSIFSESRVFDEGLHVEAGYAFLTQQDFAKEPFNPPLARELTALPSLLFPGTLSDPLYVWQRIVVVGISCMFFLCLYFFTRKLYGVPAAVFAGMLYLFHPEILGHSHYAVTDLILSFFIFLSIMLSIIWQKNFSFKKAIVVGICIGCALSCKVSAVPFLFGTFSVFLVVRVLETGVKHFFSRKGIRYVLVTVITLLITLWMTYFFTLESIMGDGFRPNNPLVKNIMLVPGVSYLLSEPIPLGGYLRTIKQVVLYNYAEEYHKTAFLLGNFSKEGFWYFYPVAFLIKTPIPFLLFLLAMIVFRKKINHLSLLVPVVVIFASSMMSTLNLGIRYILPAIPLLIIFIAPLASRKIVIPYKLFVITLLMAWYVAGSLSDAPYYLSYMNESTMGKMNRHHVLIDSNFDWGQGLVSLSNYQKKYELEEVQLAYFGMVDPQTYGISYRPIPAISLGERQQISQLDTSEGKTVVIGASCYYFCGYYLNKDFSSRKPMQIGGGSMLMYTF